MTKANMHLKKQPKNMQVMQADLQVLAQKVRLQGLFTCKREGGIAGGYPLPLAVVKSKEVSRLHA